MTKVTTEFSWLSDVFFSPPHFYPDELATMKNKNRSRVQLHFLKIEYSICVFFFFYVCVCAFYYRSNYRLIFYCLY